MTPRLTDASYSGGYRIFLKYEDGTQGTINLEGELYGEMFVPLKNIEYFKKFQIQGSSIAWENGADFAPEFLYEGVKAVEIAPR
jgi:hypothetical protein